MPADEVIDFPTLGFLVADWIERHCVVPDRDDAGQPFVLSDWQLRVFVHHYRVKPDAEVGQLAPAFHYRRSQIVRPQKTGKGPMTAAWVCAEGVGPVLFVGWADGGEVYVCAEHGCPCGWVYEYAAGEPMGRAWPTPLIQITATSEEQTDNIYDALRPMIEKGRLADVIPKTGEEFIRLPNGGRIDVVTSNARSRLGQRVTFVPQDETGVWTAQSGMVKVADTQRRGLAGMGGRSVETTNAWDPSENSVAQRTYEAQVGDIFRDFPQAPAYLSYRNKQERRRIHRHVYDGSPWVDLDAIEAEAAELLERDPEQAERFFGNRLVYAKGSWLPDGTWDAAFRVEVPHRGMAVCGGFDGSLNNDWTALRLETADGWQFTPTYGPDNRPTIWDPSQFDDFRSEVHAALDELMSLYKVERLYCDVQFWESEIDAWARLYGDERVLPWRTERTAATFAALQRFEVDVATGRLTHDSCQITETHIANARKVAKPGQKYLLGKPADHQKIDAAMASVLAHEATADALTAGWGQKKTYRSASF